MGQRSFLKPSAPSSSSSQRTLSPSPLLSPSLPLTMQSPHDFPPSLSRPWINQTEDSRSLYSLTTLGGASTATPSRMDAAYLEEPTIGAPLPLQAPMEPRAAVTPSSSNKRMGAGWDYCVSLLLVFGKIAVILALTFVIGYILVSCIFTTIILGKIGHAAKERGSWEAALAHYLMY
ncbi:hypothetical protein O988_02705 [Pseudogymnoascus sp. VKM F-3808]|nr:hypothetical protein O988_02705 [Pseudogymnoascus sp. VKM F-3808]